MARHSKIDFDDLVREFAAMVSRIASTYEKRPALIEELTQDIFLAVFRALPSYRGDASLKTFVARIANNVGVDHVRKATRRLQEVDVTFAQSVADPDSDQEDAADLSLKRDRLVMAVRALDLPLKQVVSLHLEGFTNAEIAETLSLKANNVGVRLHRAKTELAKRMNTAPKHEVAV
ncbi:MAG: RNA polymerase sigma factor [Pseudomonadota bacterium]